MLVPSVLWPSSFVVGRGDQVCSPRAVRPRLKVARGRGRRSTEIAALPVTNKGRRTRTEDKRPGPTARGSASRSRIGLPATTRRVAARP